MVLNETLEKLLKHVYRHDNDFVWWSSISEDVLEMRSFEIFDGLQLLSVMGTIDLESAGSLESVSCVKLKRKGLNHLHDIGFIDDSDFSIVRDNYKN